MSGFTLSVKSEERLRGVHPDLQRVVRRALTLTPIDFVVIEGLRTLERQRYLLAKGATQTLKSRHLTGHAVDIAPLVDGKASWDWTHYHPLAAAMKNAAKAEGVPIEWGGDWKTLKDGPHWQLPKGRYP